MWFIIWNVILEPLSLHGTCNTGACYIKITASNNSTIFHSVIEHTDFPAESPQIQFLIENSTKLLAHELTMLNANTDIELYYISVNRRCNWSWQGLLHFFSTFPILTYWSCLLNTIIILWDLGCIPACHTKNASFHLLSMVPPEWWGLPQNALMDCRPNSVTCS